MLRVHGVTVTGIPFETFVDMLLGSILNIHSEYYVNSDVITHMSKK